MNRTRRALVIALAGVGAGAPFGLACGQARPVRIGYLTTSPIVDPPTRERAAFLDEMRKLGYVIGQNLLIEYRSAQRDPDVLPQLVAELLKLDVVLILAGGDVPTLVAKAATTRIPIVFTQSPDPVGNGLVRSLAMPGGNVTGLSYVAPDLAGKRMQLLHEALPSARRVAMIWAASEKSVAGEVRASTDAAARLGLRIEPYRLEAPEKVMRQFERIGKARPDVLLVLADPRMISYRDIVIEWVNRDRLPTVAGWSDFVRAGGLLSYSPNFEALFRRSAHYVDKILKGAKPADLPVEQPTEFELVINLKTARTLDFTIPQSLLLRADEVVQ